MWGCTTPVMQPHIYPNDPPVFCCPLAAFRDQAGLEGVAFGLHLHWTKGILPIVGGLDDQAADFGLTVLSVENGVQAGRNRLQEVEHRKANKQTGAGGNPSGRAGRR